MATNSNSSNNETKYKELTDMEAQHQSNTSLSLVQDSNFERVSSKFEFPMHSAVKQGKTEELQKLLTENKSTVLRQDHKRRTPLHYAASLGNHKAALKCVNMILDCEQLNSDPEDINENKRKVKEFVDIQDMNGETALHLAAKNVHRKIVEKLIFAAADVNLMSNNGKEPLQLIYSKVPGAMNSVIDRSVSCASGEPHDENLQLELDFSSVMGSLSETDFETDVITKRRRFKRLPKETELLGYILHKNDSQCQEILTHPFVQLFLHMKWKKVEILFYFSILFHMIWLVLYTMFSWDVYVHNCPYKPNRNTSDEDSGSLPVICDLAVINMGAAYALLAISIIVAIKEIFEMCSVPRFFKYFIQLENIGQWLLVGSVFVTTWPVFVKQPLIPAWQYQAAAFGIFLAWALILSQIGKLPRLGLYVEILRKVLRRFALFILTFVSLLIAFALSLSILLPDKQAFHSLPLAILKVLVMMTGELNYDELFHDNEDLPPFPVSSQIIFATFTIIVTIILFNLLIGFTVSDIQGLEQMAQASRLYSQLEQIYLIESFLFSDRLQQCFSMINKIDLLKTFLIISEEHCDDMCLQISVKKIPDELQKDIRRLASLNKEIGEEQEDQEHRNSMDNALLKKRLRAIMEEMIAQWEFL